MKKTPQTPCRHLRSACPSNKPGSLEIMPGEDVPPPALVVEYRDAHGRFTGWLVRDRLVHGLCAGGMRIQKGLTKEHLAEMARNMTRKMRLAGLRVDGAKCGIDYDPGAVAREDAVVAFLKAIKPYVETSYSMGPDLNVPMDFLEKAALLAGIPSVKMAVARAQGWDLEYFRHRYQILHKPLRGSWTLGTLRAGYGLAAAALALLDFMNIPVQQARIAVQGFGTLARAAMEGLRAAGAEIIAVADDRRCFLGKQGQPLEIAHLLDMTGVRLPQALTPSPKIAAPDAIFSASCHILILAAVENVVTEKNEKTIRAQAIVPGANLAVTPAAERMLYERGVVVLPDFLAGCGGSLSMDGLFGPAWHPDPEEVLGYIKEKMTNLVNTVMKRSETERILPRTAALHICDEFVDQPDVKPYGPVSSSPLDMEKGASRAIASH